MWFCLVIFKRICGLHCYSAIKRDSLKIFNFIVFYDQKGSTILNIENKQICLFDYSISGYQAKLPYM